MTVAAEVQGFSVGMQKRTLFGVRRVHLARKLSRGGPPAMGQPVADHQVRGLELSFGAACKHKQITVRTERRLAFPTRGIGRAQVGSQRPLLRGFVPSGFEQIAGPLAPTWAISIPRRGACREHHGFPIAAQRRRPFIHGGVYAPQGHRGRPRSVVQLHGLEKIFAAHNPGRRALLLVGQARPGQNQTGSAEVECAVVLQGIRVQSTLHDLCFGD